MNYLKTSRLFGAVVLVWLVGLCILTYSQITFVFRPLEAVVATTFVPVLISIFIYYLFLPVYQLLLKRTGKKRVSLYITFSLILLVCYLIVSQIVPQLITETARFVSQAPQMMRAAEDWLDHSVFEQWVAPFVKTIDTNKIVTAFVQLITGATVGLSSLVRIASKSVIVLFTIPVLVFYMFKEGHQFPLFLKRKSPERFQPLVGNLCRDFHETSAAYISGKLLVCLYVAVSSYFIFLALGLPNALLLGAVCGLLDIVPYFGPFIGAVPALFVALGSNPRTAVWLIICITIVQLGESYLVSPQVMKSTLHIHPILVIFLLLIGGNLFGLLGMIVVLPTYSIIMAMGKSLWQFREMDKQRQ